ncbi:protein NPGR1 [Ananas comosus]|uniref:Protein NPGR1 n=1 Tax=Ananas comosus TaxID=4615 RepID=A0A6P5G8Y3_ANACO|nr:protein NPGR1 [Ananas comosus]XP_020105077.1 protein NPGR1 [Ananas comosus]XP_020105078.1 protein NPGR1 [Ananas comosus]XP_020105079.1 protein NPGR1 [Ananas comosus]
MLCTCSGEHFQFEDKPRSPESLATRDFSVSCLSSSRTGDRESKFDDNSEVDDVESALRETISLNYEEARALLGRLEYQRGNFNAALQVFEGIDIRGLRPRMIKAISERFRRKGRAKGGDLQSSLMSMHSVSLLLEAILLKSKSLEGLGRVKDAAVECKIILDIVESAWPHGVPNGIEDECKLIEMFHKALELLPNLWIQAGCLEEAVLAYRRALIRPWNLDFTKWASLQKDLAVILLYSGSEITLPAECRQVSGFITPSNNVEEAILLLLILMRKLAFQEISWDPDIMSHLTFALSLSGQFELLASHVEQLLPGTYSRAERWYILALCYSAAGMDEDALNILKKVVGHCQKEHKPHIPSLLLGAKLCCKVPLYALEGIKFATKAIDSVKNQEKHLVGVASHLLGACYGCCSKSSISDSERLKLRDNALKLLNNAAKIEKYDPEVIYSLGRESLMQRNLNAAVENATKYLDMVDGSSVIGWKLLALVISAQQNLKEAEAIVELAIDETEKAGQLNFFRLKALLQDAQGQSKSAIDTYRISLAIIQAQKELQIWHPKYEVEESRNLEMEIWLDLASIYTKLGSWADSKKCLEKAKSINSSFPKIWHITGLLLEAQSMHEEALAAFSVALSIQPNFVPSMVSMAEILRMLGGESLPIARSFLMNAIRLDPTNHEAWLNLGIISKMEGSLHQAADCFQAAYELRQSSPVHNFE